MRAALVSLRWRDPMYYLMFPCHKLSSATEHTIATKLPRHAGAIAAKEMLPISFYDELFKFAVVRNPWDLQVSSFHHVQRERPEMMNGITDFNEYLRYKFDPSRPFLYHIDITTKLQTDHFLDLQGNMIVDFVGRYESLEEDVEIIRKKIGLRKLSLPRKRVAKERKKDYRSYYSDESAAMIADRYARDIDLLGYKF